MTDSRPPMQLEYDSTASDELSGRRPRWVWAIVVTYGLLAAGIVLLPLWTIIFDGEPGLIASASVTATVLTLCGLGLLMTPVRMKRHRPLTRRSVWIPIIVSGLLVGLLVFAAGAALDEVLRGSDTPEGYGLLIGAAATWVGWSILLGLLSRRRDPHTLASRFHRWILGGSVAELLIAVPSHLICRRRSECCAGMMTGTAICIGVVVMFIALGPSVLMLFYRRARQISRPAKD